MNQVRSWRQLEAECQRNVEVMWLLGRLRPDYKSIAEFRQMHFRAASFAGRANAKSKDLLFLRTEQRRVVHLSLTDLVRLSKHEIQINYFRNVGFDDFPCLFRTIARLPIVGGAIPFWAPRAPSDSHNGNAVQDLEPIALD
jgi:hypothetical protein